ncbi:MAG: hypothetical protein DMF89_09320 [Acidobacteria bacterium]|nr:MAG: hypothetical protein DMF90_15810 [Acidobacteriota bacterium]PYR50357.1 MAG: hypothetical protein DMF89_09320 [Acidobacteriota bacterium]
MHVTSNRWTLVIALAALVMGAGFVAPLFRIVVQAQTSQQAADGARLMRGAVDLHYHVDPGYGVYEHLAQAKAAGVRALLLKNHYEPTGALVMLLRPQFPGLELYAGFVFNRSSGGVNVAGIEYMASIRGEPQPGKIVWLPAGDTEKEATGGRNPNPKAPFVAVSKNGQLVPEVKQALAVIARNNFTLASGHVVAEEALLAFREAKAAGVQRLIATHAADLVGRMTLEQMKEAARLGVWIEFDYRNTLEGNRTELIRGVGPEHCFLSEFWTKNQPPKEYAGAAGVGAFAAELKKRGFTDRELEMMFKDNPAKAIGLSVSPPSRAN